MKNTKKLISLLLVAVMAIGMTLTVSAANNSPSYGGGGFFYPDRITYDDIVYNIYNDEIKEAQSIDGEKVTVKPVENEKAIATVETQNNYALDAIKNGAMKKFVAPEKVKDVVIQEAVFIDVEKKSGGQVTVVGLPEWCEDFYAIISHYNEDTNKWEMMSTLAKVKDGKVTFSFNSYSPVLISVTNITDEELSEVGKTEGVYQVKTAADLAAKSPKMGQ